MRRVGCAFGAVLAVGLFADVAQAQPPGPAAAASRPVYSPYLNLVRRDNPPGFNYYGLVRPQFATQNSLQSLQQQVTTGQQQQQQLVGQSVINSDLPITGQQTSFLNTGGYFLNMQGGVPTNPSVTTRSMPPRTGGRMR